MAEIIMETQSLVKKYISGSTEILALRNIDFVAKKGEFIAIMGPSGSGKSTFLNVLGGLDAPSFGKVLVEGRDISKYTEEQVSRLRRKTIGSIFQSQDLFPALTALENVEFPLLLAGAESGARREAAKKMLERVGLGDRMEYLPEGTLRRPAAASRHCPCLDSHAIHRACGRTDGATRYGHIPGNRRSSCFTRWFIRNDPHRRHP